MNNINIAYAMIAETFLGKDNTIANELKATHIQKIAESMTDFGTDIPLLKEGVTLSLIEYNNNNWEVITGFIEDTEDEYVKINIKGEIKTKHYTDFGKDIFISNKTATDICNHKNNKIKGLYKSVKVKYSFYTDGDYCVEAEFLGANRDKENYTTKGEFVCEGLITEIDHTKETISFLQKLKNSISSKSEYTTETIKGIIEDAIRFMKTGKSDNFFDNENNFDNFYKLDDSNWEGTGVTITIE